MSHNDFRGMGPIPGNGHPEAARALEGERRRAIASRIRLEGGMALIGAGMAAVIAGAIVVAILRAIL